MFWYPVISCSLSSTLPFFFLQDLACHVTDSVGTLPDTLSQRSREQWALSKQIPPEPLWSITLLSCPMLHWPPRHDNNPPTAPSPQSPTLLNPPQPYGHTWSAPQGRAMLTRPAIKKGSGCVPRGSQPPLPPQQKQNKAFNVDYYAVVKCNL